MTPTVLFLLAAACLALGGGLLYASQRAGRRASQPAPASQSPSRDEGPSSPRSSHRGAGFSKRGSGSTRRARKEWAHQRGFEFTKKDDYLGEEWSYGPARGASAAGELTATDVVSGSVDGREVHLLTLAGTTVMALRRAVPSPCTVDIRRRIPNPLIPSDEPEDETSTDPRAAAIMQLSSPDIPVVRRIGDYEVVAEEPAPVDRCIDARFMEAVNALPEAVRMVWAEGNWMNAALADDSTHSDWDATIAPLALLADACRVLPPAEDAVHTRTVSIAIEQAGDHDPTRPLGDAVEIPQPRRRGTHDDTADTRDSVAAATDDATSTDDMPAANDVPATARPTMVRTDEPVRLPTRTQHVTHGPALTLSEGTLGTDEVEAIADGRGPSTSSDPHTSARVVRSQPASSSIFDDISSELGTDPFATDIDRWGTDHSDETTPSKEQ